MAELTDKEFDNVIGHCPNLKFGFFCKEKKQKRGIIACHDIIKEDKCKYIKKSGKKWLSKAETLKERVQGNKRLTKDERNYICKCLEERKTGKWIKGPEKEGLDDFGDEIKVADYECSICGRVIEDITVDNSLFGKYLSDYPFCHCGADMRGAENDIS